MEMVSGQEPSESSTANGVGSAEPALATSSQSASEPARNAPAPGEAASPFPTKSPLDGTPLSLIEATAPANVAAAVQRARDAQRAWAELPIRDRAVCIARVKKKLLARADEIADI